MGAADLELFATASYLLGHVAEHRGVRGRSRPTWSTTRWSRGFVACSGWVPPHQQRRVRPGRRVAGPDRPGSRRAGRGGRHARLRAAAASVPAARHGPDYEGGEEMAARVVDPGRRFHEPDRPLALNLQGRALIYQGQVRAGLSALDEAMLAVVGGEVTAPAAGRCMLADRGLRGDLRTAARRRVDRRAQRVAIASTDSSPSPGNAWCTGPRSASSVASGPTRWSRQASRLRAYRRRVRSVCNRRGDVPPRRPPPVAGRGRGRGGRLPAGR